MKCFALVNEILNASILAISLAMANTPAVAGDGFNNGGGMAEANIAFAMNHMNLAINQCLGTDTCFQNESHRQTLISILANLPLEAAAPTPKFSSDHLQPGLFLIDGKQQSFVTGTRPGDLVIYNLDKIYRYDSDSMTTQPIPLGETFGLVLETYHYHQIGTYCNEEFHELSVQFGNFLDSRTIEATLIDGSLFDLRINAVQWTGAPFPTFILFDGTAAYDISKDLIKLLNDVLVTRDHADILNFEIKQMALPQPHKLAEGLYEGVSAVNFRYSSEAQPTVIKNCDAQIYFKMKQKENNPTVLFENGSLSLDQLFGITCK